MPNKSYAIALAFALALANWSGCSSSANNSSNGNTEDTADRLTVAVIPKCTSGEFWTTVEQGVEQAASDLGVNIKWEGTLGESEIAEQNRIIENMINLEVDGIAIAPLNKKATAKPVQGAIDANIPVVIFDSGVDLDTYVSFVATNNLQGGALGAETMAELLGGKGDVLVLRYMQGTASTEARAAGFIEKATAIGLNIVGDPYPEDDSVAGSKKTAANTLEGFIKDDQLAIDGIFATNLMGALGMAAALDDLRKSGIEVNAKFIGFDTSPKLIQGIQNGTIDGLVAQAPKRMGYLAVETLVKHLRGEQVEFQIDTQVEMVTKERLENEAEIRELVGMKQ
jgi:ribose transport system substrate-binding protein